LWQTLFRSLVNIAFTVPKGIVVCFAILLVAENLAEVAGLCAEDFLNDERVA